MTNEEASKYLIVPVATSTKSYNEYLKQKEAYDLAIKALKEREALNLAIEALEKPQVTVFAENASKEEIEDFKQELENVLEKTQEGEWIDYDNTFYKCPECGYLLEKCCPQCQSKVILPKGGAK